MVSMRRRAAAQCLRHAAGRYLQAELATELYLLHHAIHCRHLFGPDGSPLLAGPAQGRERQEEALIALVLLLRLLARLVCCHGCMTGAIEGRQAPPCAA